MKRQLGTLGGAWIFGSLLLATVGCQAPGVGDPCVPETIPESGFVASETYLETSSVQCRTRVCMVYQLSGVPFDSGDCTPEDVGVDPKCANQADTNARVYCTCRCDAPPDVTATLCDCPAGDGPADPEGFSCIEIIDQMEAGAGIRGSYCVRNGTFDPTLLPTEP
jgi:hypothetical protein